MAADKNIPEIRFKGFEGEWKETQLGKLAEIVRGASPRPINDPKWFDDKSNVGWLRISDVTEQDGRIHYIQQRISKAGEEKTRVLTEQHLLLSIAASVGKPVVNYVSTGVHDGFLIFKNPNFNQEFMFQWMKMFEEQWQKYGQPGSQVNLNSEIVKNQDISVPLLPEQTQIGTYFQNLDSLISLHQRKYDKLLTVKKAMLEKMFPKEGADVPEIRFKGFEGKWEKKKKLGEIATMKARIGWQGMKKSEFLEVGDYYLITGTDFANGLIDFSNCNYISLDRYNQDINIQIKNDDVLITKDGTIGKVAYVKDIDKPATLNAGVFVIRGKENICNLFMYHYLAAPYLLDYADKQATGGTIKHLNQNVLVNFPLPFPCFEEQTKIGTFFQNLDTLITQHQKQLERLKNIKKACLEKMFV